MLNCELSTAKNDLKQFIKKLAIRRRYLKERMLTPSFCHNVMPSTLLKIWTKGVYSGAVRTKTNK
jgi:hypothetical protein